MLTRKQLVAALHKAGLINDKLYVSDLLKSYKNTPGFYPKGLESLIAFERHRQWYAVHGLTPTEDERDEQDRILAEALGKVYTKPQPLTPAAKARISRILREMKAAKQRSNPRRFVNR